MLCEALIFPIRKKQKNFWMDEKWKNKSFVCILAISGTKNVKIELKTAKRKSLLHSQNEVAPWAYGKRHLNCRFKAQHLSVIMHNDDD